MQLSVIGIRVRHKFINPLLKPAVSPMGPRKRKVNMPVHSLALVTVANITPLIQRRAGPQAVGEVVRHDGGDVLSALARPGVGAADAFKVVALGLRLDGVDCSVDLGAVEGELSPHRGKLDAAVLHGRVAGGRIGVGIGVRV